MPIYDAFAIFEGIRMVYWHGGIDTKLCQWFCNEIKIKQIFIVFVAFLFLHIISDCFIVAKRRFVQVEVEVEIDNFNYVNGRKVDANRLIVSLTAL